MIIDGHIHILKSDFSKKDFFSRIHDAGIDGGIIFSQPPEQIHPENETLSVEKRIESVVELCHENENLFPFYWIDPLDNTAEKQVDRASDSGIRGFKVICDSFYPEDKRALKTFNAIAERGYPIMFHSGILWDGKVSSKYNYPVNFEILLTVKNLRFSLAHLSWPWTDEMIAVYGKFQNAYHRNPDVSCELFIDTTPGTPAVYRGDVFKKLFSAGYDVENNIFFGSDTLVEDYDVTWAVEWIERDKRIMEELTDIGVPADKYFSENVLRFISG